jgi:3-phenylpropionate/trans-cinnamate dioxygenase ferredoxin component
MKNSNRFREDDFKSVCHLNQLKDKEGKRFLIDDIDIAVFKVDTEIFAIGNVCPHQRSALIYDGFIEDEYVVCPVHGWMFNLRTGKTPFGTSGLNSYKVRIENDQVYVKAVEKKLDW